MSEKINLSVIQTSKGYCSQAPYNPAKPYPEYSFDCDDLSEYNPGYEAIREAFYQMGFDKENYGKREWNPLGSFIMPGNTVLLKPNLVMHRNGNDKSDSDDDLFSVITHPSIIRAIVDFTFIALRGEGRIIVADSPQADADFESLLKSLNIQTICRKYLEQKNFHIDVLDLRKYQFVYDKNDGTLHSDSRITLDGDPLGYCVVDIANKSAFQDLPNIEKLYGADYDRDETVKHHSNGRNEYCISKTVLSADVIINIPKLKTHRKAGVSIAMKNFIGINTDKNYLPHFRIGVPEDGGDEYPSLTSDQKKVLYAKRNLTDAFLAKPNKLKDFAYKLCYKAYTIIRPIFYKNANTASAITGGSWSGNDTLWRTIKDLNYIIKYADSNGNLSEVPQRKILNVVDGICAGEKNGPISPQSVDFRLIAIGDNEIALDIVCTKLMGFVPEKIKLYASSLSLIKTEDIIIYSNMPRYNECRYNSIEPLIFLKPAQGWENIVKNIN